MMISKGIAAKGKPIDRIIYRPSDVPPFDRLITGIHTKKILRSTKFVIGPTIKPIPIAPKPGSEIIFAISTLFVAAVTAATISVAVRGTRRRIGRGAR
jgi:hypothetical protein